MKRIVGMLLLVGVMMMPTVALAEQLGVYVAPKFVFGMTQAAGGKVHGQADGIGSGSMSYDKKLDGSLGGSIAIGYNFNKKFSIPARLEVEYAGFTESEAKKTFRADDAGASGISRVYAKQLFAIQTLFANVYWDIDTRTKLTPYIGAGLGAGFIKTHGEIAVTGTDIPDGYLSESGSSRTVTNFAWNVGAGLGYNIADNWTLDVGYRFVGLGDVKTKTYDFDVASVYGKTDNLFQHQIAIGVRYSF